MLWIIGFVVTLSIASHLATTTREQRAAAQARFNRRWNPVFITLIILMLAFILWPWPPSVAN